MYDHCDRITDSRSRTIIATGILPAISSVLWSYYTTTPSSAEFYLYVAKDKRRGWQMYVSAGLPQQGFYRRNVGARLGTYIRLMLVSLTCLSRTQLSYADEGDLTKVGQV